MAEGIPTEIIGERPLLVLVHGGGATRAAWQPQLSGLATDADVVTIDLPAHGILRDQHFTFEGAAAIVADAIDKAGRDRAVILGLSLGGYVVMDFASRHPDRVAGLIVSGCTIDYSQPGMRILARANQVALAVYPTGLLNRLQAKAIRVQYPQWADEIVKGGFYLAGFSQAIGMLTKRYFPDGLSDFPRPILVLDGEKDRRNRAGEARLIEALPTAELVVLRGAGHICNLDEPDGFNTAVAGFLRALPAAAKHVNRLGQPT